MDEFDLLSIFANSFLIAVGSFISPWLAPTVSDKVKQKMRRSTILTSFFILCLAYSYTSSLMSSLIILLFYFYIRMTMLKIYGNSK